MTILQDVFTEIGKLENAQNISKRQEGNDVIMEANTHK